MKVRLFLIIAILLSAVMVAGAQDGCYDLSSDDCAVMLEATANGETIESFTFDMVMNATISGVPESADVVFNMTGNGPIVFAAGLAELANLTDASQLTAFPIELALAGNVSGSDGIEAMDDSFQFMIVDNIVYFYDNASGMWMGLDLMEALSMGTASADSLVDPDEIADSLDADAMAGLANIDGFISTERVGNDFVMTVDFSQLFTAPEFSEGLESLSGSSEDMESIAMLGMFAPMLVEEAKMVITQTLDPAANLFTGIGINIDMTLNLGMLAGESDMAPIVISMDFDGTLTGINEAYDLVAPEGAEMIPLDAALSGVGSF
jgi:hypothetical protein